MKNMKNIVIMLVAVLFSISVVAQDEEVKPKKEEKPVRSPYACTMIIDNQTEILPSKGGLELIIHHRFSGMDQGISNLYGFYGASNIRMALQYGLTDKLMVAFGTEKYSKMQEFSWKYLILKQTRSGSMPVSLTYYGNAVIDGRDTSNFGANYKFISRLSYFHQFIVSRKVNSKLSAQLAASYSHFNAIEDGWYNDVVGASVSGRYKIINDISAIFEYHHPVSLKNVEKTPNSGGGLGVEFATPTHAFQVFATTYDEIVPQKNYALHDKAFDAAGIGFGFNITVRF